MDGLRGVQVQVALPLMIAADLVLQTQGSCSDHKHIGKIISYPRGTPAFFVELAKRWVGKDWVPPVSVTVPKSYIEEETFILNLSHPLPRKCISVTPQHNYGGLWAQFLNFNITTSRSPSPG